MSTIDDEIVRIAERRLHLVSQDEIQRLGLSPRAIRRRVALRSLHPVLPGVYSTSAGPYDLPQRELALCLSVPGAVLSHSSAGAYWAIRRVTRGRAEVTVPRGTVVRDSTAVVHYSNKIPEHHVVGLIDGARVTSVARTVFDLGGLMDELEHLSVIEDVRNKGLCSDAELGEVYDDLCGRGRRGSAAWSRLVLLAERVSRPSMSELELEFHEALIAAGLPPAVQQHPLTLPNGRKVLLDLAYPDVRLDIEIDHSEWHATTSSVEHDKARDVGLAILGWERLRFTERALSQRLRVCVANVAEVLKMRTSLTLTPSA